MLRRTFVAAALGAAALPGLARAQVAFTMGWITPENEFERAYIEAHNNASAREGFRETFLRSNVALVLANSATDAPPRYVNIESSQLTMNQAGMIYSSASRLSGVWGPAAPRVVLTGRQALQRLRGHPMILNYRLQPVWTLEAADVDNYLSD